jgi:hypothetical protein
MGKISKMTASPDPSFQEAARDFRAGGWIVSILGIAGGLVDLLLSDKHHGAVFWIKRTIAGGLTGVIMYFALHSVEMGALYKSIAMCVSGALAPELLKKGKAHVNGLGKKRKPKRR